MNFLLASTLIDKLVDGIVTAVLGTVIVFLVLFLLIFVVKLLKIQFKKKSIPGNALSIAPAAPQLNQTVLPLIEDGEDSRIVAAITAALAVISESESATSGKRVTFKVRSIKKH